MNEENRKINDDQSSKTGEKPPSSRNGYIISGILLIIAFYIIAYW